MSAFPPGSRVRFFSTRGELLGTVIAVLEDELHTVRPDNRGMPVMLLSERSLQPEADEADVPLVVCSL